MKKLMCKVFVGALLVVIGLTGCKAKSEQGGGAGNDTFRLVVPALGTDVKQGEVQTVRVAVERDAGFKERVKLQVKAPTGIQVEPNDATVQAGDKGDVQLAITAAADAPLGKHSIQVKGTPDKGESTETEFTITVSAK